ncbi:MAG: DUF6873 family GME fold protein [Anaerovoracaceae bacterium]|jgi:hypothetical protein
MSTAYISPLAAKPLTAYLKDSGVKIVTTTALSNVDDAIATHADIIMCDLGGRIVHGDPARLTKKYPGDIIYNAACTGRYFIHNLKYTDPLLLAAAEEMGRKLINVKQGYAKCSTLIVDEDSVILSDEGMARELKKHGLDVLLIRRGHIVLPGFRYGFIGGTAGKLGREIIFNGDLSMHPDCGRIEEFIMAHGCRPKYFRGLPLMDIGSIIISGGEQR